MPGMPAGRAGMMMVSHVRTCIGTIESAYKGISACPRCHKQQELESYCFVDVR